MNQQLIQANNLTLERGGRILITNCNFSLFFGDQILLIGASGSGKSSLAQALAGKLYYRGNIVINTQTENEMTGVTLVSQFFYFKDNQGLSEFYYQQRYNSQDNENTATVRNELVDLINLESTADLLQILNMQHRIDTPLIQLSSGERKKIQLIKALAKPSPIIILDTPYLGLDVAAVNNLNIYLAQLSKKGITFIVIADYCEIPEFINKILIIDDSQNVETVLRSNFKPEKYMLNHPLAVEFDVPVEFSAATSFHYDSLVRFEDVSIRYGNKQILDKINWLVKPGDKWLLSGVNGAGKSTLLSLINGDNPQAYANKIYLFDRRRGSGETIWEIKQNIGYISPELHWNLPQNLSCLNIILSGFFDTPGLYAKADETQIRIASQWLDILQMGELAQRQFSQLSMGLQRMILLIRAIIKNPPLLIFDEPCQGLDDFHSREFLMLVDKLFADSRHSIIYVSHRLDQIPNCIHQRAILENGKLNLFL